MARPTSYQPAARRAKPRMTPLRFLWRLLLAFVKLTLLAIELAVLAVLWRLLPLQPRSGGP